MINLCRITLLAALALLVLSADRAEALFGEELVKVRADDFRGGDSFAFDADLGGGLLISGAIRDDDGADDSGSAYLFDAATGAQLHKLNPDDPGEGNAFGISVGVTDAMAIVGSVFHDDGVGAAYLFDTKTGQQLHKLQTQTPFVNSEFGRAVAIDGGYAVVTGKALSQANQQTPTAAYVYDVATGGLLHTLFADGASIGSTSGGSFTPAVAIDNGVAIIGSHVDGGPGFSQGSAYLFDLATGVRLHRLTSSDGQLADNVGISVDIDNGVAIVGAYLDDDNGRNSGSAYLFDVATGSELDKLIAEDGIAGDGFGEAVAIDDGIAIVGARYNTTEQDFTGAAYAFDVATGRQIAKLLTGDPTYRDRLGDSVAIDNGVAAISAWPRESVYTFDVNSETVPGNFSGDGVVDNDDLNLLLRDWGEPATPTGWNGRPVQGDFVDNDELNALLNSWGIGVEGVSSPAVPEPGSVWLLAICIGGGLSRRRCG
ncbi:MAG: PQQ-binding-like beta-propeller repeat protein [Planctomycetota bacterium]